MRIQTFRYHDKALGWELEPIAFGDLTLLVGVSGVGKTRILQALYDLKRIASGKDRNGVEWEVQFSTSDGAFYRWIGAFETRVQAIDIDLMFPPDDLEETREKSPMLREVIKKDGQTIITRSGEDITFNGVRIPKLDPAESTVSLLKQEDALKPVSDAFRRMVYSDQSASSAGQPLAVFRFDELAARYDTLPKIQESDLDTFLKLALVHRNRPEVFARIEERFIEIFPQVQEVTIEPIEEGTVPAYIRDIPMLRIKEQGVADWIDHRKISSGMWRVILHLAELYLWPDGTVILIDEFENSLGVNCIDVITDDLLSQQRGLQFVLTSHHPYIINRIEPRFWKIVTRRGGLVSTHDYGALGLGGSSHEAFIQLINNDLYRDGIGA